MFTVIEITENKRKLLRCFYKNEPQLFKVPVKDGLPYFKIFAEKSKKFPWDDILYMAKRCSCNILISDEISFPDDLNVKKFVPQKLPFILLLNSTVKLLNTHRAMKLKIGVNDPYGAVCEKIHKLIPFSAEITVVTQSRKYQDVVEKSANEYGISIILTDNISSLGNSDIIISEKAVCEKCCFSTDKNGYEEVILFSDFELLPVYKQKIPSSVNEDVFASALYELCHAKRIGELYYNTVEINGIKHSVV